MNWLLLIIPVVKIIIFLNLVKGFFAKIYLIDEISDQVIPPIAIIIIVLFEIFESSEILGGIIELNNCFLDCGTKNDWFVDVDNYDKSKLFHP